MFSGYTLRHTPLAKKPRGPVSKTSISSWRFLLDSSDFKASSIFFAPASIEVSLIPNKIWLR